MSDKSRLLWRCRRGIREMDIILMGFIEQTYGYLSNAERQDLTALLDEADLDILNWLMGKKEAPNPEFKHLIKLILQSRGLN